MPEIVSDEYREGYAAFYDGIEPYNSPYDEINEEAEKDDWMEGWLDAESDWKELIGEKSV